MTTPSFSLAATERVLPKFALDFTTASLDPRVVVTRAGATATRINSSGFIETTAADTPRFDFNPVSLACRGLLVENTATNFVFDSAFSSFASTAGNNVWIDTQIEIDTLVNAAVSPGNTQTAALVAVNTAATIRSVSYRANITSAGNYTFSFFAKKASTDNLITVTLAGDTGAANGARSSFSLTGAGSVSGSLTITGTATNAARSITAFSDEWYRCSISCTLTSPTNITVFIFPGNRTTQTTASQNYVWGAQIETGLFGTSYIPTTVAAVTRNADVAQVTGTNFSAWYSPGAGALAARVLPSTISGVCPAVDFSDGTADNAIVLRGNGADPELFIRATTDQAQIDAGTIAANTEYTLAGAWNTDDCAAAINGAAAVTDTSAAIPTVTQARLGSDGTNYLNGHLQTLRYWPQRLINAEVQAFSK